MAYSEVVGSVHDKRKELVHGASSSAVATEQQNTATLSYLRKPQTKEQEDSNEWHVERSQKKLAIL